MNWQDHDIWDLNSWLEKILMEGNMTSIELLFMLLWSLWNERNTIVWTGKRRSPSEVVDGAMRLLIDFKEQQVVPKPLLSKAQAKW